jgi:hypothetical protein
MLFMARSVRETEAKKSLPRHIQKKHFIVVLAREVDWRVPALALASAVASHSAP